MSMTIPAYTDRAPDDAFREGELNVWRRVCDEEAELERLRNVASRAQKAADDFADLVRLGEGLPR